VPPNLPPVILSATRALLNPANLPPAPEAPSQVKWVSSPSAHTLDASLLSLNLPSSSGLAKHIAWHRKGDYFATVCKSFPFLRAAACFFALTITTASGGGQGAVWIHQISRRHSQAPFKKIKGTVQIVLFHPLKPHFFVAVCNSITCVYSSFETGDRRRHNAMFGYII
jgi:ribosome biogenesis protein ERB1